ncbi:hypothetical protein PVAP13_3NG179996 [Panicum virgatum]|uniref:Peroxisomal membrane protein PEX14 n=1 Tax=Panicum virgatum TaxID=38727 RepID=A0A8T0U4U6_PANVG|nr:hypothetical protein PVAP13_3NG179996 [Panicum virgatum]
MEDLSTFTDGEVAEEAKRQAPGQGSSEGSHSTLLQGMKEQETRKGKAAVGSTELMREDLVQSAVSFLKHPKVVTSLDGQRRSFLENKGLTVDEIDEAFRRLQIMEMIQRGERPDDIQDINDDPPNPDQPISEPRMAPKPKPWEKQGQESSAWDLKSSSSDSSELRSEVQQDSTNKAMKSADSSHQGQGGSLLQQEVAAGSESPTVAAATS